MIEVSFGKAWANVSYVATADEEEAELEKANSIARGILAEEQILVAFPKYVDSTYQVSNLQIEITPSNNNEVIASLDKATLAADIGSIAKKSLDQKIARTRVRALARAAIKYSLSKEISNTIDKNVNDDV
jgi:hypothetical protein